MAQLETYAIDNVINNGDTVIGADAANSNVTRRFTMEAISDYVRNNVVLSDLSSITATAAEINVLDGITASVSELNILDGVTATAAEINIVDGLTATTAELNFVSGVTSNIQTQLDGKASAATGAITTVVESNLTASRALLSNSDGKIAVSDVTSTELGYLDGVTSSIQTQINDIVEFDPENTGNANQVLQRTSTGYQWADANAVSYTLPTAGTNTLGGVIVPLSSDIDIDSAGNLTLGNISANKITSGTIGTARLPDITTDEISSGSANDGYVLTADGAGNVAWEAGAGSGGHVIQEAGTDFTGRTNLNFASPFTVTDDETNDRTTIGLSLGSTDIPNLNAAKITTGVLNVSRLSTDDPSEGQVLTYRSSDGTMIWTNKNSTDANGDLPALPATPSTDTDYVLNLTTGGEASWTEFEATDKIEGSDPSLTLFDTDDGDSSTKSSLINFSAKRFSDDEELIVSQIKSDTETNGNDTTFSLASRFGSDVGLQNLFLAEPTSGSKTHNITIGGDETGTTTIYGTLEIEGHQGTLDVKSATNTGIFQTHTTRPADDVFFSQNRAIALNSANEEIVFTEQAVFAQSTVDGDESGGIQLKVRASGSIDNYWAEITGEDGTIKLGHTNIPNIDIQSTSVKLSGLTGGGTDKVLAIADDGTLSAVDKGGGGVELDGTNTWTGINTYQATSIFNGHVQTNSTFYVQRNNTIPEILFQRGNASDNDDVGEIDFAGLARIVGRRVTSTNGEINFRAKTNNIDKAYFQIDGESDRITSYEDHRFIGAVVFVDSSFRLAHSSFNGGDGKFLSLSSNGTAGVADATSVTVAGGASIVTADFIEDATSGGTTFSNSSGNVTVKIHSKESSSVNADEGKSLVSEGDGTVSWGRQTIEINTSDPSEPRTGEFYYNSSTEKLMLYDGTSWISFSKDA